MKELNINGYKEHIIERSDYPIEKCKEILDQDPKCMILEISGDESTVEENINILSKFKVLELLRSGKMAMISGDQERNKPVLTRSEP